MKNDNENMQNITYDVEHLKSQISKAMSPKCYAHSLEVAYYAQLIATKTEVDPQKMYVAGLLHDIAKERSNEELLQICENVEEYIPFTMKENAHSLHGIAGACLAYSQYGIRDNELLMAIAFHSGRAGMRSAEKILFLADTTSQTKKYGCDPVPAWKKHSLDEAILAMCAEMIRYCIRNDVSMDERTQDGFDYVISQILTNTVKDAKTCQNIIPEDTVFNSNIAVENINSHKVKLESGGDVYDIGGYETLTKKTIKTRKIISAALWTPMTPNDVDMLKKMGVNTIIDLRTEDEREPSTYSFFDDFRYFSCSIPSFEACNTLKRMPDYIRKSATDEETAWYMSEFMHCVLNDKVLRNNMLLSETQTALRQILEILECEETNGVLIYDEKDEGRVDVVSRLLQLILGVDTEVIFNNYYVSLMLKHKDVNSVIAILDQFGYVRNFSKKRDVFERVIEKYINNILQISNEVVQKLCNKYLD